MSLVNRAPPVNGQNRAVERGAALSRKRAAPQFVTRLPPRRLLCSALDGERAEFGVLVTDLSEFFVLWVSAPSLYFFDTVPDLHDNALWRLALDCYYLCSRRSSSRSGGPSSYAGGPLRFGAPFFLRRARG